MKKLLLALFVMTALSILPTMAFADNGARPVSPYVNEWNR